MQEKHNKKILNQKKAQEKQKESESQKCKNKKEQKLVEIYINNCEEQNQFSDNISLYDDGYSYGKDFLNLFYSQKSQCPNEFQIEQESPKKKVQTSSNQTIEHLNLLSLSLNDKPIIQDEENEPDNQYDENPYHIYESGNQNL